MRITKVSLLKFLSIIVVLFGFITLKAGGSVVLDIGSARANQGNYLPFVVWFNFLSGFVYIISGIGLWFQKKWSAKLSVFLLGAILAVYAFFIIYVLIGGLHDPKTIFAMAFRTIVWGITAFISCKFIGCKKNLKELV